MGGNRQRSIVTGLDGRDLWGHTTRVERKMRRAITQANHLDERAAAGLALLFRKGTRPSGASVRALAAKGGFSIAQAPQGADDKDTWLELLVNGLTFDLVGLGGGPAASTLAIRHRFGIEEAQGGTETVMLVAGAHLAGGEAMLPIVRSQLALAVLLAQLPGLVAIGWAPAQSRMATDYFCTVAAAWLEGGSFPALGLAALVPSLGGGLQSEGLAFFTGQELRIDPELAKDRPWATRLAVGLIDQLTAQEPVVQRYECVSSEGVSLVLEPSADGDFVSVCAA